MVWMEPGLGSSGADMDYSGKFPGYWMACNKMIQGLIAEDPTIKTVVIAADDMLPDPYEHPDDIETELYWKYPDGYFVMQPTGDDKAGMDGVWRICGSPWFGLGWIKEAFNGDGPCPLPPKSFYGDEFLFEVCKREGVLWQRPDLSHLHKHYCRNDEHKTKRTDYQESNSKNNWDADKAWFMDQKEKGYPLYSRKK